MDARGFVRGFVPVLLVAALSLLGSCASDSEKKAKPAELAPIESPVGIERVWEVDLGNAEGLFLHPCVLEHAIYAAARDGELVRVDPANGRIVWRISVDGGIGAGVGSDGVTIAVAGPRGNVLAFNAEGRQLWEVQASSDVVSPPLVGHGLVIVHSTDQRISAYEIASGKRRWVYQKQGPSLSLRVESQMVFSGESVLSGFPGGRLGAISLSNGASRWEAGVSEPKGPTEVDRLADVIGVPALADPDVCAASYQGRIGCFDAGNGDLRWAREFSAGAGVAVAGDALVGVDADSHVRAFQRGTGASLWQNGALANRGLSAPAVLGKLVAVGDFEGFIHFLKLDDGHIVGRFDASSGPLTSTPQVWNGALVLQTSRGRLLMLAPAHR